MGSSTALLVLMAPGPVPRLDPLTPWGPDEALIHSMVFESIVEPTRDGWRSDVVASLSEEAPWVVVELHKGLRWHDGEPVVSADVCATVDALLAPGSPSPYAPGARATIEGCEHDEERTARVVLRPGAEPVQALSVPLLPAHHRPAHDGDPRAATSVGCGPYRARPTSTGWRLEATGSAPFPAIQWVADVPEAAAAHLVRQGDATAVYLDPSLARTTGAQILPWDRGVSWAIALDPERLDDVRVRRAVDRALDRDVLASLLGGSSWPRTSGPFPTDDPRRNHAVLPTERDRSEADHLLREAGYQRLLDGRWHDEAGDELTLTIGVPAGLGFPAEGVASAWSGSGIQVTVVPIDRRTWSQGALGGGQRGHLDALLVPRPPGVAPAAWFHRRRDGQGWLSPFDAGSAELDALALGAADDPQAGRSLHGALAEQATWLFLFEERRPSAWPEATHPWFSSRAGWDRIDRWGR